MSKTPDFTTGHLQLPGLTKSSSPAGSIDSQSAGNGLRPFGGSGMGVAHNPVGSVRMGAGSPSYDAASGSKIFSKRAREIQAEEGVNPGPVLWGPISNSNSSSHQDSQGLQRYPEPISQPSTDNGTPSIIRRARAGTLPSRFGAPGLSTNSPPPQSIPQATTSRPSPAPSPFQTGLGQSSLLSDSTPVSTAPTVSSVTSRLRSGSLNLPQRTQYLLGSGVFPSPWETKASGVGSANIPTSPAHSSFSKDDDAFTLRTLDYLGLADTPQPSKAQLAKPTQNLDGQRAAAMQPFMSDMGSMIQRNSRLRSYSVNAKEKYAEDEEEDDMVPYNMPSGQITPAAVVAAYTLNRPRARTAGVLDTPPPQRLKSYVTTPSRLADSSLSASEYFDGLGSSMDNLTISSLRRSASGEGLAPIEETQQIEGPTRSLWLGNIPSSTTTSTLMQIFSVYGPVESARVLTHKSCGFVNFERLESAVQSRNMLNGKEIFPGAGPIRIGYAKVQAAPPQNQSNGNSSNDTAYNGKDSTMTSGRNSADGQERPPPLPVDVPELKELKDDILNIARELDASPEDLDRMASSIDSAVSFENFLPEIPSVQEPRSNRVHDAPKLREIRKRIDNNSCSKAEIEDIALGMLDEIAELSSDYLGNTVVQKLFEHCSDEVKEAMLEKVAPHLAEIGIHKNGTWACQKIIDVANTPKQMSIIVEHLRPYTVALFLDQFGNYVLQCCLRFGENFNGFVFETMMNRMWEIAQGRYGARAMRACLESHVAKPHQTRMLAACIALHSVQLASNSNGALLLTWFLDTCNLPKRRTVLAPRLVPHLVHLCTHKVAYLTVLKVINQRAEPEARDVILKALFFSPKDQVLEDILRDHSCGATLIFKVLTTPYFDETLRAEVVQTVRNVLLKLKAQPGQGYKRLMDEVGLSTRNGPSSGHSTSKDHQRDNNNERSRQNAPQAPAGPQAMRDMTNNNYYLSNPATLVAANASQIRGLDASQFQNLEPLNPVIAQQLHYQALLQQMQQNQQLYAGIPAGMPFAAAAVQPTDFRANPNHAGSPVPPPPQLSATAVPGFNPVLAGQMIGAYPYTGQHPMLYQPQQAPQQQQQGPNRRGRVR